MIDIPMSPDYVRNREKLQHDDLLPCICCGKPVKNQKHFLRVFWGNVAVTHSEATEIITKEGHGGDLLYYPVGQSCLKKYPQLKPYAEDAAKAMKEDEDEG